MWVLYLNPMQASADTTNAVAWAEDKATLERFVAVETAPDAYKDGAFFKRFLKDGPLEWYNPPELTFDGKPYKNIGTLDEAIANVTEEWHKFRSEIFKVV